MELLDRCRLLLDQLADRVPPAVLAGARSYAADGEWEASFILIGNAGVEFSLEQLDLLNDLLAELAEAARPATAEQELEPRRELLAHPSHYQYYVRDWDADYDPEVEALEGDELISVHAARHLVQVRTGMYGFDLPLTVEVLDAEPAVDLAAWQEVSEATATFTGPVLLVEYILINQGDRLLLPAEPGQTRSYRLRVHARGRAEAAEDVHVSAEDGDPLPERHLIRVWPAPFEPLRTWKP